MSDAKSELLKIWEKHQQLTPQLVVDEARDPGHPLHSHFDWDNKVAGEKWRRHQAHELIRTQKVQIGEDPETGKRTLARAFHSVPTEEGMVFDPLEKVAQDPHKQQLLLTAMKRRWKELYGQYKHLAEFFEMVREDLDDKAA